MPKNSGLKFYVSRLLAMSGLAVVSMPCLAQTPYNFGNPTAEEQSYLELINRARANPSAEGLRLATSTDPSVLNAFTQYGVNLTMLKNEFNAIPVTPPLAPSAGLTASARVHSLWMLNNATQSHNETNPSNDPGNRITAAGYNWATYGENIYAYSADTWFGHAGFQVDWGPGGTGGMQSPRGHRNNIHNATVREIGVGIQLGTNGAVGPQLVTQDFGLQLTSPTFGTGVAYYDLNANNFYDAGEGIAGLTVNVSGTTNFCTTAIGGGWTVPIPTNAATRTVTFSGLNMNNTASLVVPASTNAKADLKLTYEPPSITSASTAASGTPHSFSFTAIGGATGYKWNRWNSTATAAENCDNTTNITSTTTGTYSVLSTSVKKQGTGSFHLQNSTAKSQIIQLNPLYYGLSNASLAFQSSVRYSMATERFKVQVKEEGSSVWKDAYDQAGYGSSGESVFTARTAALTSFAGKAFRVRFILYYATGGYYTSTGDNMGWFVDEIAFTNVSTLINNSSQTLAGASGSFTPSTGTYLMSVSPVISGSDFPASYQTLTVAVAAPPSFATWASSFESSNSLVAGALANNPNADQDKDGRANLLEYAFGTSPVAPNDPAPRMPVSSSNATYFILQYQRDTSLTDIALTPQASADLGTWKSPGQAGAPAGFTDTLISTAGTIETRQAKIPRTSGGRWFMKVQVSKP